MTVAGVYAYRTSKSFYELNTQVGVVLCAEFILLGTRGGLIFLLLRDRKNAQYYMFRDQKKPLHTRVILHNCPFFNPINFATGSLTQRL